MPYDPQGALGGLFAPAFIRSGPDAAQSEQAVLDWTKKNFTTGDPQINASRNSKGVVDSAALKSAAQGVPYDATATAQRNAIAAQVVANSSGLTPAQQAYQDQHIATYGYPAPPEYFSGGGFDQRYGSGAAATGGVGSAPLYQNTLAVGDPYGLNARLGIGGDGAGINYYDGGGGSPGA